LEKEATEQEQDEDIRIAYNDGDKAGTQLSNENYDKELSILVDYTSHVTSTPSGSQYVDPTVHGGKLI
jgi:hypothetical protein